MNLLALAVTGAVLAAYWVGRDLAGIAATTWRVRRAKTRERRR